VKGSAANLGILLAVVVIVAGVAWFRSNRPVVSNAPASAPASQPAPARLPRVVDLGADKCKACRDLAPILAELKKEYAGRVLVEFIDVWKDPKAGEPYQITVIPTQVFFDRQGQEVWRHVGFLPKADFIAKFAELGVK
jgi:thioredoxin 1